MENWRRLTKNRIKEFEILGKKKKVVFDFRPFLNLKVKSNWKSELAFCISVANSSAISGLKFQKEIENTKIESLSLKEIEKLLKKANVRFFKRKAFYIKKALKNFEIVENALKEESKIAREMLVKKIKGIGYKEASHYLRNLGRKDLAILDRHMLRWMFENGYIEKIPRNLAKKKYLEIEKILEEIAKREKKSLAVMDLDIWFRRTGRILK